MISGRNKRGRRQKKKKTETRLEQVNATEYVFGHQHQPAATAASSSQRRLLESTPEHYQLAIRRNSKTPIDYVLAKPPTNFNSDDDDDAVSQLTMQPDDFIQQHQQQRQRQQSPRNNTAWSAWTAGFTSLAEDFLSAKSIHYNRNTSNQHNGRYNYSSSDDDDSDDSGDVFESLVDDNDTDDGDDDEAIINKQPPLRRQDPPGEQLSTDDSDRQRQRQRRPQVQSLSDKDDDDDEEEALTTEPSGETAITITTTNDDNDDASKLIELTLTRIRSKNTKNLDKAIDSILQALRLYKERCDAKGMVKALKILAEVYIHQEEYDLALSCYQDAQRILERRALSSSDQQREETACILNLMGTIYARQGDFYQAMEKHQQALQLIKTECSDDNNNGDCLSHPIVSQTLILIGNVYHMERNDHQSSCAANDDYKKFVETGMLDVIAQAHEDGGSYLMALSFLEEKLQLMKHNNEEMMLKRDYQTDEETQQLYFHLGSVSCKSGLYLEAIDYYEQALEIQMQLGCTEADVASVKVLIGTVQSNLGHYRKALILLEEAHAVFERVFGHATDVVADVLREIGVVKSALWHHDDALANLQDALAIQVKLYEENDLEVCKTKLEIYSIQMNRGGINSNVISTQVKEILQLQRAALGAQQHPILADTLLVLGKVYMLRSSTLSTTSKALRAFQESYDMRQRFLGQTHPIQAETHHQMARLSLRRERFQHALEICKSVLGIRKESLFERHVHVASTLCLMGCAYAGMGKFVDSQSCLDEALSIAMEAVGENHPNVGEIHVGLGALCLRKCDFMQSRRSFTKGLEIYSVSQVPREHLLVRDAQKLLERVDRDEMLCV